MICQARVNTQNRHAASNARTKTMTLLSVLVFAELIFLFARRNLQTNEQRTIVTIFALLNII